MGDKRTLSVDMQENTPLNSDDKALYTRIVGVDEALPDGVARTNPNDIEALFERVKEEDVRRKRKRIVLVSLVCIVVLSAVVGLDQYLRNKHNDSSSGERECTTLESYLLFSGETETSSSVFLSRADGSHVRLLVQGGAFPVWSRDSGSIAYVNGGDVWVMNPDASGKRRVTESLTEVRYVTWSPNGTLLCVEVVLSASQEVHELYLIPIAGGPWVQMTNHSRISGYPSWSSDGALIAYDSVPASGDEDSHIRLLSLHLPLDSPNRSVVVATGSSPRFSPDGAFITYNYNDSVWVMTRDGTEHRLVVPPPQRGVDGSGSGSASFSPHSERIAFERHVAPSQNGTMPRVQIAAQRFIWARNETVSQVLLLHSNTTDLFEPVWSGTMNPCTPYDMDAAGEQAHL